jgi:hypothetical protein
MDIVTYLIVSKFCKFIKLIPANSLFASRAIDHNEIMYFLCLTSCHLSIFRNTTTPAQFA